MTEPATRPAAPTTRAFAHVLTLLSMGISAAALGAVLHNLVDVAFGYTRGTDGLVTFAASTLVVVLPVFVALFLWLHRQEAAGPELDRASRLAVQVTLVVAFLWALSSLATYVYGLLNATSGEPYLGGNIASPLGNAVHTLVTLTITGAVFAYWRVAPRRTPFRRTVAGTAALAAVCVAAVATQAALAGPIRADAALADRIATLGTAVDDHARTTGALPPSIDVLGVDTTGVTYTVTGPRTFTLCATFATAGDDGLPPRPRPVGYVDASEHPAGPACFPAAVSP
jgi:hypothetical protein